MSNYVKWHCKNVLLSAVMLNIIICWMFLGTIRAFSGVHRGVWQVPQHIEHDSWKKHFLQCHLAWLNIFNMTAERSFLVCLPPPTPKMALLTHIKLLYCCFFGCPPGGLVPKHSAYSTWQLKEALLGARDSTWFNIFTMTAERSILGFAHPHSPPTKTWHYWLAISKSGNAVRRLGQEEGRKGWEVSLPSLKCRPTHPPTLVLPTHRLSPCLHHHWCCQAPSPKQKPNGTSSSPELVVQKKTLKQSPTPLPPFPIPAKKYVHCICTWEIRAVGG